MWKPRIGFKRCGNKNLCIQIFLTKKKKKEQINGMLKVNVRHKMFNVETRRVVIISLVSSYFISSEC